MQVVISMLFLIRKYSQLVLSQVVRRAKFQPEWQHILILLEFGEPLTSQKAESSFSGKWAQSKFSFPWWNYSPMSSWLYLGERPERLQNGHLEGKTCCLLVLQWMSELSSLPCAIVTGLPCTSSPWTSHSLLLECHLPFALAKPNQNLSSNSSSWNCPYPSTSQM